LGLKKLAIWVSGPYKRDELFNPHSVLNRDDCLACFQILKNYIEAIDGQCHTQDVFQEQGSIPEAVLFLDIPEVSLAELLGKWDVTVKKYVILQECAVIIPRNWDHYRHAQFDKIFTWNDKVIDNEKYIKLNFSQLFPDAIRKDISKKTKLCTMIAGNKKSAHELELYSKRVEAIRWFEKNHPEDFDLYGVGWDEYRFEGKKIVRGLNRVKFLTKLFAPYFPSYKGKVIAKKAVLEKYKFAICYENAKDIPGYITEKIFDCFFAGCIPVYWGADNVKEYIPLECFIDRRDFNSFEELYKFMKTMSNDRYHAYLGSIEGFLKSEKASTFSCDYVAKTVLKEIVCEA
jgi:hypothetical protein